MNATGLCQCGCGEKPTIAGQTDPRTGAVKGQPNRFVRGHQRRTMHATIDATGYVLVVQPENPRASSRRIHEHVAVVEKALGHALPPKAVVHHVNDIRSDNRNDNLAALQDQAEHIGLHMRRRVLRAGGNPWTQRICSRCQKPKDLDQFDRPKDRAYGTRCLECSAVVARERKHRLRRQRGAA